VLQVTCPFFVAIRRMGRMTAHALNMWRVVSGHVDRIGPIRKCLIDEMATGSNLSRQRDGGVIALIWGQTDVSLYYLDRRARHWQVNQSARGPKTQKNGNSLPAARYLRRKQTIQSMAFRLLAAHVAAFRHKCRLQVPPLLLLLLLQWLFYWTSPLSTADIEVPGTPMVTAVVLSSHLEANKNNKRGRNIAPLFWPPQKSSADGSI
jgi:hypothetical protein